MKPIKTLVVAIAGLVLAAATSHAVLLSDLIQPGATLQQGDKIFGNFTWLGPTGPAGFTINGIGDGTVNNLYGIQIGGPLVQIGAGSSDWQLGYSVTVATGAPFLISDIHQYVNVSGSLNSVAQINEVAFDAPGGNVVANSTVGKTFTVLDQNDPPAELTDRLVLSTPLNQVWITKDIFLSAVGPSDYIATTIIEQRFSQVPEPTTAGCFLLGLGALTCFRRFTQNRRS
jgi:hypothetical protein